LNRVAAFLTVGSSSRMEFEQAFARTPSRTTCSRVTRWPIIRERLSVGESRFAARVVAGGWRVVEGKLKHSALQATLTSHARLLQMSNALAVDQKVLCFCLSRCQQSGWHTAPFPLSPNPLLSIEGPIRSMRPSSTGPDISRPKARRKLHLVLDHDDILPCYAVITAGKASG